MTDDLVKRMRVRAEFTGPYSALWDEAADRIEQLEAALREIAAGYKTEWSTSTFTNMIDVAQILSERISIARKALGGKND